LGWNRDGNRSRKLFAIEGAATARNTQGDTGELTMRNLLNLIEQLQTDEEGAALIEYTVLLGILLIAVIATIGLVGKWINGKWTALQGQLS
jgi:pilus assembly protein Flp/PilA